VTLHAAEVPIALALGDHHSCALTQSGSVFCWGGNEANQLGAASSQMCADPQGGTRSCSTTPIKVTGIPALPANAVLRAAGSLTCAIDALSHAYCWGQTTYGQLGGGTPTGPVEIVDPTFGAPIPFTDIAVGGATVCGWSAGQVLCWGQATLGTASPDGGQPDFHYPAPVQFY
jgi:alpha-tubulin suppressor-like RCC1 family protein